MLRDRASAQAHNVLYTSSRCFLHLQDNTDPSSLHVQLMLKTPHPGTRQRIVHFFRPDLPRCPRRYPARTGRTAEQAARQRSRTARVRGAPDRGRRRRPSPAFRSRRRGWDLPGLRPRGREAEMGGPPERGRAGRPRHRRGDRLRRDRRGKGLRLPGVAVGTVPEPLVDGAPRPDE